MTPNRRSQERKYYTTCYIIRTHFILFLWSSLTLSVSEFVVAKPISFLNPNSTKGLTHDSPHSANLTEDIEDSNPSEIQKAVCTVTAGDVRASAEAYTTKTLKGVCGSAEMSNAFTDLEIKLTKELESIKNLLVSLSEERACNVERNTSDHIHTRPSVTFQPIPHDSKLFYSSNESTKEYKQTTTHASAPTKAIRIDPSSTAPIRERDIFNNTLHLQKNMKIFTYYWKIENFTKKLENGSAIIIESPAFSIKGRKFKIKASFQHLHRDFLFLQLEDASLLAPSRNSIILETGGIFKEIQNNSLKYKISVLQQNAQRRMDLVSQEFDNHETGFLIPNSALLDSPFVKDDSLLIQIFLYI